jgi:hypothetical protein
MKKFILSFALITSAFFTQAQMGGMAMGLGSQIIGNRPQAKLQKHWMFNAQSVLSLGISNVLGGGRTLLPPTFLSAEYGIRNNYTVGVMVGGFRSETKDVYDQIQTGLGSIIGNLGLVDDTAGGTHSYRINYTLIGVTGKYNFVGGPKSNLFISTRAGFKMANKTRQGNDLNSSITSLIGSAAGDEVTTLFNAASNYFAAGTFGMNLFIDKDNKFAITPEVGLGTGWGDGINLGAQSLLLSVGVTYHIMPARMRR